MVHDSIFDIHDVVLLFPIIECLVFVFYRISVMKSHQLSSILLNVLLLIVVISALGLLAVWNEVLTYSLTTSYFIVYFAIFSFSLRGPILLLYIQSFASPKFRLKIIDSLHLLPVAISCFIVAAYSLDLNDLKYLNEDPIAQLHVQQVWYFVKGVAFIYVIVAVVLAWRKRRSIEQEEPLFSVKQSTWITLFLGGVVLNYGWALMIQLVSGLIGGPITDVVGAGYNYMFFIQVNLFFVFGLYGFGRQMRVEDGHYLEAIDVETDIVLVEPEIVSKIVFEIEMQQCYLEPHITIEELSERINIPTRTLSRAINQHFDRTFLDCINSFRIKSAKKIMLDPEKSELTILDILYMSGFNSASSFHRYFKRLEDMTPAEYRRLNYPRRKRND
ncbi:MAG: AraC-like DNA-binding protein [Flavobacteriales bacterium]